MWIPEELGWMARRLKGGHRVNRITVRDLLRMFKAERRGLNKIQDIKAALDSLDLVTDPDFESEWIDGKIRILLKDSTKTDEQQGVVNASTAGVGEQIEVAENQEEAAAESAEPGSPVPTPIVISSEGEGVVETKLRQCA